MIGVAIKPISVNECWKGQRYKTDRYKKYEQDCLFLLPNNVVLPLPPYQLNIEFGFSSKLQDFDNPVKPFVDILQKKYKFNDRLIKRCIIDVVNVHDGGEYVAFELITYKK